jgi:ABC-type sulfate/molybdate transport systems ATPase subunit
MAANIAYGGQRDASPERVREAADAAYLLTFIESLPQGFETRIGENAVKLSAARQRLVARALLKNAPILLLDEATSALDSESSATSSLAAAPDEGRTTFVVAHRLSTIERADRIVVGRRRVVEIGPHRTDWTRGLYARLHIQFASGEETVRRRGEYRDSTDQPLAVPQIADLPDDIRARDVRHPRREGRVRAERLPDAGPSTGRVSRFFCLSRRADAARLGTDEG